MTFDGLSVALCIVWELGGCGLRVTECGCVCV